MTTRAQMHWKFEPEDGLGALAGKMVRFILSLEDNVASDQATGQRHLYSFWVSKSECGESSGYTAGGGPGIMR